MRGGPGSGTGNHPIGGSIVRSLTAVDTALALVGSPGGTVRRRSATLARPRTSERPLRPYRSELFVYTPIRLMPRARHRS